MIKVETIGSLNSAKINPIIISNTDVRNHSFITHDGVLYLINNACIGDDTYKSDVTIPAGEYLNGYQIDAWVGKKLVIDGKHIQGGIEVCHAKGVTNKVVEIECSTAGEISVTDSQGGAISDVKVYTLAGTEVEGEYTNGKFESTTESDIVACTEYKVYYTVTHANGTYLNVDPTDCDLEVGSATGIYFEVTDFVTLTEPAVKVVVHKS